MSTNAASDPSAKDIIFAYARGAAGNDTHRLIDAVGKKLHDGFVEGERDMYILHLAILLRRIWSALRLSCSGIGQPLNMVATLDDIRALVCICDQSASCEGMTAEFEADLLRKVRVK